MILEKNRKVRLLLISPPHQDSSEGNLNFGVYVPIGILSLAANVNDVCEVDVLDCLAYKSKKHNKDNQAYYGMPPEDIEKKIKEYKPDIIGISIPFTTQLNSARLVRDICRRVDDHAIIVFGGPHASAMYSELLLGHECDYCVIGEGEITLREFVLAISNGTDPRIVSGLASLLDGLVNYNSRNPLSDLDELPFPAYDKVHMNQYQNNSDLYINRSINIRRSISMVTSRGCPFDCIFCSIHLHMGKKYRYHSPEYVIEHIKHLINNYDIRHFHFEDDNLSFNISRFEKILDLIISNNLSITWDTPNGIRADTLNQQVLAKMKQSGCIQLIVAIESGSQKVLNEVIKKQTSLDKIIQVVKDCHKLKIDTEAFFVIGFPGESIDQIKKTCELALSLCKKYSIVPHLQIAVPMYGTKLYQLCWDNGYVNKKNIQTELLQALGGKSYLIETDDFTKEDLILLVSEYKKRLRWILLIEVIKDPYRHIYPLLINKKKIIKIIRKYWKR